MDGSGEKTTILIPGKLHARAVERIGEDFLPVAVERADPMLLTQAMKETVRGVASATVIDAAFIDALPNLEIIANFGVGYDGVDAAHAGEKGVMVTNTPDVLTEEVADTALGLLINTVRELPQAERYLREGRWSAEGPYPLTRGSLRGRKVGIFGMGRIGRAIARRVEAFGLPVSYHNRSKLEDVDYEYHSTLLSLAEAVDTLISVAPGGTGTDKAVNADIFSALGANGVFVNIGRGTTVDESALAAALRDGKILGAGLDVFADEPEVPAELLACENAVLLPHVGSASRHTRQAMADLVVDNLVNWFEKGEALTPVPETARTSAKR